MQLSWYLPTGTHFKKGLKYCCTVMLHNLLEMETKIRQNTHCIQLSWLWIAPEGMEHNIHRNRSRDPDGLAMTGEETWHNLPGESIKKVYLMDYQLNFAFYFYVKTRRGRGVVNVLLNCSTLFTDSLFY